VPEALRDEHICKLAVISDWRALRHVPVSIIDSAMCMLAVQHNAWSLSNVPIEFRTRSTCTFAVQKEGRVLQYVPDELKDRTMCELALQTHGRALYDVPIALKDRSMCTLAVQRDGCLAMKWVPEALRKDPLILSWAKLTPTQRRFRKCSELVKSKSIMFYWMEAAAKTQEMNRIKRARRGDVDDPLLFTPPPTVYHANPLGNRMSVSAAIVSSSARS
jgi:hypothetical protein